MGKDSNVIYPKPGGFCARGGYRLGNTMTEFGRDY